MVGPSVCTQAHTQLTSQRFNPLIQEQNQVMDNRANSKNVSAREARESNRRELKCKDCGKPITFRYFTRFDANRKPIKSWRCAFDNTTSKYKHQCSTKQTEAQAPHQQTESVIQV